RRHTRSKRDWSSDVCSSDLKSNKLLILFVALTLIVGGLFWYQRHSKIKKAAAVISAYSQIMKKADYQKLPALLSSQSVKKSAYRSEERRVGKECRSHRYHEH